MTRFSRKFGCHGLGLSLRDLLIYKHRHLFLSSTIVIVLGILGVLDLLGWRRAHRSVLILRRRCHWIRRSGLISLLWILILGWVLWAKCWLLVCGRARLVVCGLLWLRFWRWSLLFPEKKEEERAEQGKADQRPNYSTSDPGL